MTPPAASRTLRLGLIGAGPWGRNYIRTIAGMDGLSLARLASRNPESAGLVGPGCEVSADWRAVIEAGDLDGVIVATPPSTHAEIALAAIGQSLPVLVEKPMTLDPADADRIVGQAEAAGAIVKVDHVHLYAAAWEALKRQAAGFGSLRAVTTEAGGWGPFRRETPMLWDWGSHDVAMCLDLVGRPPAEARARRREARDVEGGRGEVVDIDLDFGGVTAAITVGSLFPEERRLFAASFERGALVYDDRADVKLRSGPSPGEAADPVPVAPGQPLARAVRSFAETVRKGRPDIADARLGAEVVRTLGRIDESLA
ncbi:MAG: Gfo/Idh/MocA family protein [Rhodospirillales bacterium]